MSINTYQSAELATRNKILSDAKNHGDSLTINGSSDNRSDAYFKGSAIKADLHIKHIENTDVTSEQYYDDLLREY